jgi:G:T-mismatch repair DNA endonuclease (very short patch repair protein)
MLKCKFCQKEFKDRRCFSVHINRMHKNEFKDDLEREEYIVYSVFGKEYVESLVEDYKNEKHCVSTLPVDISKLLFLMGIKRSSKEERKTKRYKDKYLSSIQEKYGDNITNVSQVQSVQKKKEETFAKNYGSYEEYLSQCRTKMMESYVNNYKDSAIQLDAMEKCKSTCLLRYGQENFGQGKEAKEKKAKTKKETIEKWTYEERLSRTSNARASVTQRGGFSSKPEKRIRFCLTELGIDFESNKHMWHYNYDMVFGKYIIEVQGDFWHANPELYKADDLIMGKIIARDLWIKDERKKKKANENGYTLIPIWENEITKKTDEELISLVEQKLIENEYYN